MVLEGVVTNVANFGAFVDIGVHQDGLVHVSQLADRFVKDPRDVVKAGDIVKVSVVEVDLKRRRIALSMKSQAHAAAPAPAAAGRRVRRRPAAGATSLCTSTSMGAAFSKASRPRIEAVIDPLRGGPPDVRVPTIVRLVPPCWPSPCWRARRGRRPARR